MSQVLKIGLKESFKSGRVRKISNNGGNSKNKPNRSNKDDFFKSKFKPLMSWDYISGQERRHNNKLEKI